MNTSKVQHVLLKNKDESVCLYHATHGVIVVNPDQEQCYLAQGWRDTPVSIQTLEEEASALREEINITEKTVSTSKKGKKHEKSEENAS